MQAITQGDSIFVCAKPNYIPPARPQFLFAQSSGSTGTPKVIRRTPQSWIASFEISRAHFGLSDTHRYGVLGPLHHSLSLYACVEALHLGADLALMDDLSPQSQAACIMAEHLTVLYATPTQLALLQGVGRSLPSVRHVFCGGGHLDRKTRQSLARLLPHAQFREFFGASETSFITISDNSTPTGSVGQAYPGVTLDLRPFSGEAQEIWVKSPYLFEDYVQGRSDSTQVDDGFVAIGELGRLDTDGNLYLLGRKDRMVTVADQNVFPESIEALIEAQPGVTGCAVIAQNDAKRGHQVICCVEGACDVSALRRLCRDTLGPAHVPRVFHAVSSLPRLPMGKPDYPTLKRQIAGAS
jgi:long-chain acyl-CoA synthetase